MRRRSAVDRTQPAIVAALRALGASVQHLHVIGKGCPDICVGYRGRNYLVEIKDGGAPPNKQRLTADEVAWARRWRGQVVVLTSVAEAVTWLQLLLPDFRVPETPYVLDAKGMP